MPNRSLGLDPALHAYLLEASSRETPVQQRLREATADLPGHDMAIPPEQAQCLQWIVGLIGARRCLEVGTFTGYATLAIALALPEDGTITACEVNTAWTEIAWRFWREAGIGHRIFLRVAPAVETLDALLEVDQADSYDFAFIHADARRSIDYFERVLLLVRRGGVIAIGGTLPQGSSTDAGESAAAIRELNRQLRDDARVDLALVPLGRGMTLLRRR